ncbi:hypothetical protein V2G26_012040 [Clonostachys chloroleuca]
MVALCGKRETVKRNRVQQTAKAYLPVKIEPLEIEYEPSPSSDRFPLLLGAAQCPDCVGDERLSYEERTFTYCRPTVMNDHFDDQHLVRREQAEGAVRRYDASILSVKTSSFNTSTTSETMYRKSTVLLCGRQSKYNKGGKRRQNDGAWLRAAVRISVENKLITILYDFALLLITTALDSVCGGIMQGLRCLIAGLFYFPNHNQSTRVELSTYAIISVVSR